MIELGGLKLARAPAHLDPLRHDREGEPAGRAVCALDVDGAREGRAGGVAPARVGGAPRLEEAHRARADAGGEALEHGGGALDAEARVDGEGVAEMPVGIHVELEVHGRRRGREEGRDLLEHCLIIRGEADAVEGRGQARGVGRAGELLLQGEVAADAQRRCGPAAKHPEEREGPGLRHAGGEVEVELDPEDVEISLDELVAQTLGDMQEELDARSAAIADAKEAVPVLEIPDLSALSSEETEEIQKTMTEMKEAFGIAGEYAKGLSGAGESLEQLAAGMQELQTGVSSLSQGSRGLTKGLEQFDKAVRKAAEGSSQLSRAFGQISSAGCELGSAYWLLVEGMDAFAEGVSEFDSEGIQSLAELAGPDYLEVIRCVRAAREAEREFTNFSGISEGQKGSVKFVIETEKVGE